MANVKYQMQHYGAPRTYEQQLYLLAIASKRAWDQWNSLAEVKVQGLSPALDEAMRFLVRQIMETDVFMSGVHHGEGFKPPECWYK
jgi:Fe-S cluster biosynthesis and repair protein YggX